HDCQPGGGTCIDDSSHVGPITVVLSPLSTGVAGMTDGAGVFCPGQTDADGHRFGCFGSPECRSIRETGTPAGPITKEIPTTVTLAAVFCIDATHGIVDRSADLPGPGAVSLPRL